MLTLNAARLISLLMPHFFSSCRLATAIRSQGYLEMGETAEQGAAREAREELNAEIDVRGLLAVYSLPHIGHM